MFFFLTMNTLNESLRKAILSGSLTQEELRQVYQQLKEEQEEAKGKSRVFSIVVCVILAILLAFTAYLDFRNGSGELPGIIIAFILCAAGLVFVQRHSQYGMQAAQFNYAMKKGYPELKDQFKL